MELFYLNEHTSCYNYSKSMQEGFRYYKFDEGLNHEEELVKDCILFVLKGSLQFSCNGFQFTVSSGEMVFFCRDSLFNTQSLEKCEVVAALFHFHEIKLKELFWNIRFYYSRQELANFFYMIIGRSQDFKNKVLNNYKSCRTVKELASACDISLSAFKRQFSAEFGEAPAEWMQKQLLGEIKYKLSVTDLPLGTIANELEFSSLAHFSRFCKRCLGCSPRELRQQIKGG